MEFEDYEVGQRENVDAQGGLACLAQARQNRPGIGELDLTNILKDLTGLHDPQTDDCSSLCHMLDKRGTDKTC